MLSPEVLKVEGVEDMPNTFVNDFLGKYMKATIRLENKKMKIKEQVNNNSFRYCTLLETLLETLSTV